MNVLHPFGTSSLPDFTGDMQACEKYCVFERGDAVFAILATSIREVGLRPKISTVPGAHPLLAGLGHVRNEFLPFLRLDESAGCGHSDVEAGQMVIVSGGNASWGLLVDRVIGLMPLEVSLCSDGQGTQGPLMAVMGSATLEHRVVRVLDERAFLRIATETLNRYWTHELQEAR